MLQAFPYALIGNKTSTDFKASEASFRGLVIYLHHHGTFWPGASVATKINLAVKENVDITYKVLNGIYLNIDKDPCTEMANYSFTDCLMAYVEQTAGCKLDWFIQENHQEEKYCEGAEDIQMYMKVLKTIDFAGDRKKTTLQTGQWCF